MTDIDTLFEVIDTLPPQELQRLREYIEQRQQISEPPVPEKQRILGLHAHLGPAWMSDDFNDELPDEFWGWDK